MKTSLSLALEELSASVRRTPLLEFDRGLYVKAENFQTRGSYKIRGVMNVLRNRTHASLLRGVSTISAGNLGQSLAYAAAELGIPCRVYVPDSAPDVKKNAIRKFGAELVERPFAEIWDRVVTPPTAMEAGLIHPCFSADLRAGYEGIATEILEDLPDAECVVIPYGLGGLTLGVASALKKRKPGLLVFAAEIENAPPVALARGSELRPGAFVRSKLVDAIGTPALVPGIYARVAPLLAGSVVIDERETAAALRELHADRGLVVEGAAAVAYAAAEKIRKKNGPRKIVAILSGRNIDPHVLFNLKDNSDAVPDPIARRALAAVPSG